MPSIRQRGRWGNDPTDYAGPATPVIVVVGAVLIALVPVFLAVIGLIQYISSRKAK